MKTNEAGRAYANRYGNMVAVGLIPEHPDNVAMARGYRGPERAEFLRAFWNQREEASK